MANINNINVNGTTYNIVDDEAMRLASNPTNQNILVTNASGQAVDSGVSISEVGSGGTTIYDDSTAYDELTFETIASGVDTVKVGIDMDLLWTNSSPTSDFSAQTVSLDLSDYSAVLVSVYIHKTVITELKYNLCLIGGASQMEAVFYGGAMRTRDVSATTTGVTFGNGIFWSAYNSTSSRNVQDGQCIPHQIYGIR